MARIYGTIESLKSLKSELEYKGVLGFSSVKEIKDFLSNYHSKKLRILNETSIELEKEYFVRRISLKENIQQKAEILNIEKHKLNIKISDFQTKIDLKQKNKGKNLCEKLIANFHLYILKNQYKYFVKNYSTITNSSVKEITKNIESDEIFMKEYETEMQNLIEKTAKNKIEKLEYTRNILENSRNLISGAIGENLVVKEISKLSDDYILINDFNLHFSNPIFFKKYDQRIYSIQIDHLLISKAGIFIIETKNWSKASVNSINLRSPIEQIERSNFALYVYISEHITLNKHHWGEQQIPIRNLIIMINNKPNGNFKYVKIKLLKEVNAYINYFEPVLTDNQMDIIVNKLIYF